MQFEFNFVREGLFNLPERDWWGFDINNSIVIKSHWKLAHLAVEMGLFKSVSQANKNGWAGEIPLGFTQKTNIGKMKLRLFIHNAPDEFMSFSSPTS